MKIDFIAVAAGVAAAGLAAVIVGSIPAMERSVGYCAPCCGNRHGLAIACHSRRLALVASRPHQTGILSKRSPREAAIAGRAGVGALVTVLVVVVTIAPMNFAMPI